MRKLHQEALRIRCKVGVVENNISAARLGAPISLLRNEAITAKHWNPLDKLAGVLPYNEMRSITERNALFRII